MIESKEAKEIGIGDVVQLKSGGPKMTVTKIEMNQHVKKEVITVCWFNKDEKLETIELGKKVLNLCNFKKD